MGRIIKNATLVILALCSSCLTEKDKELGNSKTFVRILNGGYNDVAEDMSITWDGGVILLVTTEVISTEVVSTEGSAASSAQPRYKIKLIKVNQYGHVDWQKSYPEYGSSIDSAVSFKGRFIARTGNFMEKSGYLVVGDSIQVGGQPHIRVMLTDDVGNIIKAANIQDAEYEALEGMAATIDENGNYIVLGAINSETGSEDVYLAALDGDFNVIWKRAYGAGNTTLINKLFRDDESGALFWGGSVAKNEQPNSIRMVKTPPNSQSVEFDVSVGKVSGSSKGFDFSRYGFGFAFIGSTIEFGNENMLLTRVDKNGQEVFSEKYGVPESTEQGMALSPTPDGGMILLGFSDNSRVSKGGRDFYLVKVNAFGATEWEHIFGSRSDDTGVAVLPDANNGFIVLGNTSFGGLSSVILIKTDRYGNLD